MGDRQIEAGLRELVIANKLEREKEREVSMEM